MNVTTLNIDPQLFWGIVSLGSFALACLLVVGLMASGKGAGADPLEMLKANLGLKDFSTGVFLIALLLWGVVFVLLTLGLIWLIWVLIWQGLPVDDAEIWNWRFGLAKLTALVATLGAVVALPVTLQRLRLTRQQTNLSAEALFNDKINAAANDLHARRLVTMNPDDGGNHWDYWQDDIIKRNAAIDRLEGLVRENPETAERVARMLGIYVRELSSEHEPVAVPDGATLDEVLRWAGDLFACRSDMENATQTLGRLRGIERVEAAKVPIDLRGANLQGFDLRGANFDNARLDGAKMQGAVLTGAKMQGANLRGAKMQGANLTGAKMQGAVLWGAEMQGAVLRGAQMDSATSLTAAYFQAASVREVDYTDVNISQVQVDELFYDGSVTFAPDIKRAAGREEELDWQEFDRQWRAWQNSIGYDRDAPDG